MKLQQENERIYGPFFISGEGERNEEEEEDFIHGSSEENLALTKFGGPKKEENFLLLHPPL